MPEMDLSLLDEVEAELERAASGLSAELPQRLETLTAAMRELPLRVAGCSRDQAVSASARLGMFQSRLTYFWLVVERGSRFLDGYAKAAGLAGEDYGPGTISPSGTPASLSLQV